MGAPFAFAGGAGRVDARTPWTAGIAREMAARATAEPNGLTIRE
jgi:hypothetical protein